MKKYKFIFIYQDLTDLFLFIRNLYAVHSKQKFSIIQKAINCVSHIPQLTVHFTTNTNSIRKGLIYISSKFQGTRYDQNKCANNIGKFHNHQHNRVPPSLEEKWTLFTHVVYFIDYIVLYINRQDNGLPIADQYVWDNFAQSFNQMVSSIVYKYKENPRTWIGIG